jgi:hypothetical protein
MAPMGLYRGGVGGGRLLGLLRRTLSATSSSRQECQPRHHHHRPAHVPDLLDSAQRKERFYRKLPRSLRVKIDGRCLKEPVRLGSEWRTGDLILPCASEPTERTHDAKRRLITILIPSPKIPTRTDLTAYKTRPNDLTLDRRFQRRSKL